MSWIHNILQMFKGHEDLEDDIQSQTAIEPVENQVPLKRRQTGKEVEARVVYQYPKGNFRFPLIPDGKSKIVSDRRNREPVKETIKEENTKIQKVKKPSSPPPAVKKQVTPPKNGHPFRPTEIPSPVFGFAKPKPIEVVEHELTNFSMGEPLQNNIPVVNVVEEKVIELVEEKVLSQENIVFEKETYKDNVENEMETKVSVNEDEVIQDKVIIPTGEEVPVLFDDEPKDEVIQGKVIIPSEEKAPILSDNEPKDEVIQGKVIFPSEEEAPILSDDEFKDEAIQGKVIIPNEEDALILSDDETKNDDSKVSSHVIETLIIRSSSEDIPTPTEENNYSENQLLEQEQSNEPKQDQELGNIENNDLSISNSLSFEEEGEFSGETKENFIHEMLPEEAQEAKAETVPAAAEIKSETVPAAAELKAETIIRDEANEDFPLEETESKQEIIQEREQPRRNHLPFNVMMLKQDKRKWEQKSFGGRETIKPAKEISNNKSPAVPMKTETEKPASSNPLNNDLEDDSDLMRYHYPERSLLNPPVSNVIDNEWLKSQEELLNQTLHNFNVGAKVVNVTQGPSVTRFEVQPEPGVKVNKITNLSDDIKLSLAAKDIRIEAPIPGKHTIGIEVPNQISRPVPISEIIETNVFKDSTSPLTAVLGLDISGKPIITDLKKMPHGLIAGATGSGKSVCINTILISLLYKASPEDLKLLLIDPKMVELAPYNQIPHLVSPVITDVKAATAALKWAVEEMERRYELFAHAGVRDIGRFNELALQHKRYSEKLPFIVIVIDELADLMMMSPADVEEAICRIAQKARACGIHLIIATQRPSVDVITGLIKANVPTRIAFSVSSQIDSRTIIDISGAEKLLGRGDMLFLENGSSKPVRLQGTFVSDEEIDLVVAHAREQQAPNYLFEQEELLKKAQVTEEEDELFYEACEFVIDQGGASTSSLQRRFKIGYNRAARLVDMMEKQGYISGARGSKPREVLISEADLESIQEAGAF
ncbi:DNA translocase FtsK [Bacillus sp. C11]|nr:DNA translocase FtsK [Neobacillus terrae]NHM33090.1 DNA translocase FtsK [Neobacillus terrae]